MGFADKMRVDLGAVLAEFFAMTLFVIIGCGSAMGFAGGSAWVLQVSLTFGLAITALAYTFGHYSGGHINCAVTLGLVLAGQCDAIQGFANFWAQIFGSLFGSAILCLIYPSEADMTKGHGSNAVNKAGGYNAGNAFFGEVCMTFLLVLVVLQTACHPKSAGNRAQACIAIGFAVFLAHSVMIPIDGCSINPTRSFGPAVVAQVRFKDSTSFDDHFVFWLGPLIGAALAAGVYRLFILVPGNGKPDAPEKAVTETI